MELTELEKHWQALGEDDPLWAILSTPGKRGGAWDPEEFFATGRSEVAEVLQTLDELGILVGRSRALDFGCGVGRLTRALADQFERCDGVDLAASMIERAGMLNPDPERVSFHHNEASNLALFADGSFDFVLSLLVLQHMEPRLMRGYVSEFLRVLRPGGVAYFNIPQRQILAEELPRPAWRASVSLGQPLPALEAGREAKLQVSVVNQSTATWPAEAQLQAGNHWLSPNADVVVTTDDGRAPIEMELRPGDTCTLWLEVRAPQDPGSYVLEIDVVQEWISWFANRGSQTLRLPATVVAGAVDLRQADDVLARAVSADAAGSKSFAPTIEMYVLSREEVESAVEESGGVILEALPSRHNPPTYPGMDYVVARGALSPARIPPRSARRSYPEAPARRAPRTRPRSVAERLRGSVQRALVGLMGPPSQLGSETDDLQRAIMTELDEIAATLAAHQELLRDINRRITRLQLSPNYRLETAEASTRSKPSAS